MFDLPYKYNYLSKTNTEKTNEPIINITTDSHKTKSEIIKEKHNALLESFARKRQELDVSLIDATLPKDVSDKYLNHKNNYTIMHRTKDHTNTIMGPYKTTINITQTFIRDAEEQFLFNIIRLSDQSEIGSGCGNGPYMVRNYWEYGHEVPKSLYIYVNEAKQQIIKLIHC